MSKLIRDIKPFVRLLGIEENGGDFQFQEDGGVVRFQQNRGTDTEPEWEDIIEIDNEKVTFLRDVEVQGRTIERWAEELEDYILEIVQSQLAKGALTFVDLQDTKGRIAGMYEVIPVAPLRTNVREGTGLYIPSSKGRIAYVTVSEDCNAGEKKLFIERQFIDLRHGDPVLVDHILLQALLLVQPGNIQKSIEQYRQQSGYTHTTVTIQEGTLSEIQVEGVPVKILQDIELELTERRTGRTVKLVTSSAVEKGAKVISIVPFTFTDIFEIGSKIDIPQAAFIEDGYLKLGLLDVAKIFTLVLTLKEGGLIQTAESGDRAVLSSTENVLKFIKVIGGVDVDFIEFGIIDGQPGMRIGLAGSATKIFDNEIQFDGGGQRIPYLTGDGTELIFGTIEVPPDPIEGNFIPVLSNTLSLGRSGRRWANVYAVLGNFSGTVAVGNPTSSAHAVNLTTADGRYVRWYGELSSAPANPQSGGEYHDTTLSSIRKYTNNLGWITIWSSS